MLASACVQRLNALRVLVLDELVPFWASTGFDAAAGRFHEQLTLQGLPDQSVPRRCMVQARQVFSLCTADRLNGGRRHSAVMDRGVDSLAEGYPIDAGRRGCVYSIDGAGTVVDGTRDVYAHAFVVLALSNAYRTVGDRSLIDRVDQLLAFLDEALGDPVPGSYRSHDRADADALRSQNPHMHLLEALLSAEEAFGSGRYVERAEQIVTLFQQRMFNHELGVIPESFDDTWNPLGPSEHTVWEPGHQFEWAWLLDWYSRLTGSHRLVEADRMIEQGLALGMISNAGVVDSVVGLTPPTEPTYRLWPQTEFIKALSSKTALMPHDLKALHDVLQALLDRFLSAPSPGCWIDRLDGRQHPASAFVPASSLYHLTMAMSEVDNLMARIR